MINTRGSYIAPFFISQTYLSGPNLVEHSEESLILIVLVIDALFDLLLLSQIVRCPRPFPRLQAAARVCVQSIIHPLLLFRLPHSASLLRLLLEGRNFLVEFPHGPPNSMHIRVCLSELQRSGCPSVLEFEDLLAACRRAHSQFALIHQVVDDDVEILLQEYSFIAINDSPRTCYML